MRVRDIGQAVDGPENQLLGGWQNGKQGILLVVFKQPGANVIDTVEQIKAALPRLEASIPPSIKVSVVMDRTLTIRASVADVQFTLMLSIALVVMVIFLFLRSMWATIIPSITVPVALICTFAVMYPVRLQPGQPVADGVDDRGRASWWTMRSSCWRTSSATSRTAWTRWRRR